MFMTFTILSGTAFIILAVIWLSNTVQNALMKSFFIIMSIFSVIVLLAQCFNGVDPSLPNGMRLW